MNKGWKCNNCGHQHEQTDDLAALGFYMTPSGVCITRCQACGSYVIAHRWALHGGEFLVVKARNKIQGKGAAINGRFNRKQATIRHE